MLCINDILILLIFFSPEPDSTPRPIMDFNRIDDCGGGVGEQTGEIMMIPSSQQSQIAAQTTGKIDCFREETFPVLLNSMFDLFNRLVAGYSLFRFETETLAGECFQQN